MDKLLPMPYLYLIRRQPTVLHIVLIKTKTHYLATALKGSLVKAMVMSIYYIEPCFLMYTRRDLKLGFTGQANDLKFFGE